MTGRDADPGPSVPAAAVEIRFCSRLPAAMRGDLERLLFFNPNQHRMRASIEASVSEEGSPEVCLEAEGLRVGLAKSQGVECLFAVACAGPDESPAGVVVFKRDGDTMFGLHVAVAEEFAFRGRYATLGLTVRLVEELRRIGSRIRGVEWVALRSRAGPWFRLPAHTRG